MDALPTFAGFPGGMELLVILFLALLLFGGGFVLLVGGGYALLRGSDGSSAEQERIEELEREVADLREQLDEDAEAEPVSPQDDLDPAVEEDTPPEDER